jgi:hypothetical protein
MPYAPQTVGTYDTLYQNLTTQQCRVCHGANTLDRHHSLGLGCSECHEDALAPVGECAACHTQDEATSASATVQRGHHVSYLAESGQCSACHNLVADYDSVPPPGEPLATNAPCPENCRSCHKAATALAPPLAGLDGAGPENVHHNPQGAVVTPLKCDYCHNPALPHYDQRQIRVCGRCHASALLHAVHPPDICLGCHNPLTRLIYIAEAGTTDAAGTPRQSFAPAAAILYRMTYDVVGKPGVAYTVKAVVTAFGQTLSAVQTRQPGRGYQAVIVGQVPAGAVPGKVKAIVYRLKLKRNGVLITLDKATGSVTIAAP